MEISSVYNYSTSFFSEESKSPGMDLIIRAKELEMWLSDEKNKTDPMFASIQAEELRLLDKAIELEPNQPFYLFVHSFTYLDRAKECSEIGHPDLFKFASSSLKSLDQLLMYLETHDLETQTFALPWLSESILYSTENPWHHHYEISLYSFNQRDILEGRPFLYMGKACIYDLLGDKQNCIQNLKTAAFLGSQQAVEALEKMEAQDNFSIRNYSINYMRG